MFKKGDIVRCIKSNVVDKDHYSVAGKLYKVTYIEDDVFLLSDATKQALNLSNGSRGCDANRFEVIEDPSELVREVL